MYLIGIYLRKELFFYQMIIENCSSKRHKESFSAHFFYMYLLRLMSGRTLNPAGPRLPALIVVEPTTTQIMTHNVKGDSQSW